MRTYVSSGKFDFSSVVLWTLASLVAGAVIGIAYTLIANFNPFIYLNFLALAGVVLALTWCVVFIVKKSRCRNRAVTAVVTLLTGLFSWYVGWCFLMTWQLESDFLQLFVHPGALYEAILFYADNVNMTLNNSQLSPDILKVCYAIEFLAFLVPVFMVLRKKLYYCEKCGMFHKSKDYFISDTEKVAEHLEAITQGDLSVLTRVEAVHEKADNGAMLQYKLNLHYCPGCREKIYNFYHLRMKEKKGKIEVASSQAIVTNVYAESEQGGLNDALSI